MDENGFRIRSNDPADCVLELSWLDRDTVGVELRDNGLVAAANMWWNDYVEEPAALSRFFAELARDWKGWQGDKAWGALEHPFTIKAGHDRVGQVGLTVALGRGFAPDAWTATVLLTVDAGQLEQLATAVARFVDRRPV